MLPPDAAPNTRLTSRREMYGSTTTGTFCDFTFRPPSFLTARSAALCPTALGDSSLLKKRLKVNQKSVCFTPFSSARRLTEREEKVPLYWPTKPSELASVTSEVESDQFAPCEFVMRLSNSRPALSASFAISI